MKSCIYKSGDLPPKGYLAWHEWAEVQRKTGIKQVQCANCGLWNSPQELIVQAANAVPICIKCAKIK
jgi:hypothetical protein